MRSGSDSPPIGPNSIRCFPSPRLSLRTKPVVFPAARALHLMLGLFPSNSIRRAPGPVSLRIRGFPNDDAMHWTDARWRNRQGFNLFPKLSGSASVPVAKAPYKGNIRARRSSGPARPYIARLRAFRRLICLSVWPLLQVSVIAFLTASISLRKVRANRCIA